MNPTSSTTYKGEMEAERLLQSPNNPPTSGTGDTHRLLRLSSDATSKGGPDAAAVPIVFPFCPPLETSGARWGRPGWSKGGSGCAHFKSIVWGDDIPHHTQRAEPPRRNFPAKFQLREKLELAEQAWRRSPPNPVVLYQRLRLFPNKPENIISVLLLFWAAL